MTTRRLITIDELVELVRPHVEQLRRAGQDSWFCLCPFHSERTGSFHIYKGRRGEGRWHCQGCGADGDGIDWLRKIDGKTFLEAGGRGQVDRKALAVENLERLRQRLLQRFKDDYLDRHPEATSEEISFIDFE